MHVHAHTQLHRHRHAYAHTHTHSRPAALHRALVGRAKVRFRLGLLHQIKDSLPKYFILQDTPRWPFRKRDWVLMTNVCPMLLAGVGSTWRSWTLTLIPRSPSMLAGGSCYDQEGEPEQTKDPSYFITMGRLWAPCKLVLWGDQTLRTNRPLFAMFWHHQGNIEVPISWLMYREPWWGD